MIHIAKRHIGLALRGFCMGAADIVPGVSGGTMAFILGIYEELIDAIRLFGRKEFWGEIVRGNMHRALLLPKWGFLCSVGAGILCAGVTLAAPLEHLLETQPTLVWAFFFGLVAASVLIVAARIRTWRPRYIVALIFGCLVAYVIVGLVPLSTPDDPWFLVLCGAIAICAMILPGISGSFLLVLLGKYEFVLNAVNEREFLSIGYIGIGAVAGIIAFSQVLGWLFRSYHDLTVALLVGMMIGSLRKIWPWKEGAANILPSLEGDTVQLMGYMAIGAIVVFAIEILAHRSRNS